MKARLRIPTGEYAFVELEVEDSDFEYSSIDEAVGVRELYDLYEVAFADKEGLNQNEWAEVRNVHYSTGEIDVEDFEKLNKWQRLVINQDKLSFRANRKEINNLKKQADKHADKAWKEMEKLEEEEGMNSVLSDDSSFVRG